MTTGEKKWSDRRLFIFCTHLVLYAALSLSVEFNQEWEHFIMRSLLLLLLLIETFARSIVHFISYDCRIFFSFCSNINCFQFFFSFWIFSSTVYVNNSKNYSCIRRYNEMMMMILLLLSCLCISPHSICINNNVSMGFDKYNPVQILKIMKMKRKNNKEI